MTSGGGRPKVLQAILGSRLVQPVGASIALARLTDRPAAFVTRELARIHAVHRYRLRDADVAFHVEHGRPDVQNFDEIFYQRLYEPPPPAQAVLDALGRPPRVLDLGGNIGLFGVWLAARGPFERLDAFEPDERNAEVHVRTIAANGLQDRWILHRAAAGTRDGTVRFVGGQFALSHIATEADDPAARPVRLVDVVPAMIAADFVKMDIEGGEWAILADPRLARSGPSLLVLEYHPEGCPAGDPHATAAELLAAAGYVTAPIFQAPNGVGMLWAWRAAD